MHAFIRVYDLCVNSEYTCVCVCVVCARVLFTAYGIFYVYRVFTFVLKNERNREREIDEKRAVLLTPEEEFEEQLA